MPTDISKPAAVLAATGSRTGAYDKTNRWVAALVTLISGIVYWMTVQPTVSFWDCGEFVASSYILGIPHPPGSPLFIIIGRLFSALPIVADVGLRVNLISVLSSAFIALFAYLIVARMINHWYTPEQRNATTRLISYVGGFVGAMFAAFGRTNWGNAVEAEVYGLTLMLSLAIVWLALKFFDARGTSRSFRYLIIAVYLALLGVGLHLTVFLVVPVAAIFFVIKKDATRLNWIYICTFFVVELLLILVLSFTNVPNSIAAAGGGDAKGPYMIFLLISGGLFTYLAIKLYHHINIPWVIALAAASGIMVGFWPFIGGLGLASVAILVYARFVPKSNWRSALLVILVAFMGFSVNLFIPVRSSVNPRIDENNPSKDFQTFVDFLERKQYGSTSMTQRMFVRRGLFENQFGRSPHMGFWSYFEEQYSPSRWGFAPFLLLGLGGVYFMMRRKLEIGYPYLVLLLLSSVGLILYMNFADGMEFNPNTNDAYMEVRNRDYFFTPMFIFFGMAIGLGVAALMELIRTSIGDPSKSKQAVLASSVMAALVIVPFNHNYFVNDRSQNYFPYDYANNILASVPQDGILFTSGDNDTFPLWCLQEAYRVRRDVRIANLSLLNTDWYVEQMKNRYGVPMDLTDDQILTDRDLGRPKQPFKDRARRRDAYLVPHRYQGRALKVQDMMVDEISIAAKFQNVCFTAEPYAESELNLRARKEVVGVINVLNPRPPRRFIDIDKTYDLYANTYQMRGLDNPGIYKDDNATGVLVSWGFGAVRVYNEYMTLLKYGGEIMQLREKKANEGLSDFQQSRLDSLIVEMNGKDPEDTALYRERAVSSLDNMINSYPEFWMPYIVLAEHFEREEDADSATALEYLYRGETALQEFADRSPDNANYLQDLGLIKFEISKRLGEGADEGRADESLELLWAGFEVNENNGMAFQKLLQYLFERGRHSEIREATLRHAAYTYNHYSNPNVQQILGPPQERLSLPLQPGQ